MYLCCFFYTFQVIKDILKNLDSILQTRGWHMLAADALNCSVYVPGTERLGVDDLRVDMYTQLQERTEDTST